MTTALTKEDRFQLGVWFCKAEVTCGWTEPQTGKRHISTNSYWVLTFGFWKYSWQIKLLK